MYEIAYGDSPSPLMEDGERYPFVLISNDDETAVYSDSLSDIAGFIIGNGYADMDNDDRRAAREDFAVVFMSEVIPLIYPSMDEIIDMGIMDEDLLTYYANLPDFEVMKANGVEGEVLERDADGRSRLAFRGLNDDRKWDYVFPFLGVSFDWAPDTWIPAPEGNTFLFDVTNDKTFMESVVKVGAIMLENGYLPPIKFLPDANRWG